VNLELPFESAEPELDAAFAELDRTLDAAFLREVEERLERADRGEAPLELDETAPPPAIAV
jgi:hypothetical protein